MKGYADSSFILRLVLREPGTEEVVAVYRRLDRPSLSYLPLHALEVENSIRQRAFYERQTRSQGESARTRREREAAFSRLTRLQERGALSAVTLDMDGVMDQARHLSRMHTDRIGARAIDVLHVACAKKLACEIFLTCDHRQFDLAKAAGIKAELVTVS